MIELEYVHPYISELVFLHFFLKLSQKQFEAQKDKNWILAIQEELNILERSEVWTLASTPSNHSVIKTKWAYQNKMDENGIVIHNKAGLVVNEYNKEEGIDFDERFASVARLEAMRMLFAFASNKCFKVYQMAVNSGFLNGFINDKVYVE